MESFYQFLWNFHPEYLREDPVFGEEMPEVPLERASTYYSPRRFLEALRARSRVGCLDRVEEACLQLVELLSEASGVPERAFGVSGSTMLGMHREDSDLDLLVYGREEGLKVYEALGELMAEGRASLKPYSGGMLRKLWLSRLEDTQLSFEAFSKLEAGRRLEGIFHGREYFIRLLNPPSEAYGEVRFKPKGWIQVEATIADSSQSIFTPCIYRLEDVKPLRGEAPGEIVEAYSLRGRFCEAAKEGEKVLISGKLEEVFAGRRSYLRIVLGGSRNDVIMPTH